MGHRDAGGDPRVKVLSILKSVNKDLSVSLLGALVVFVSCLSLMRLRHVTACSEEVNIFDIINMA